MNSRDQEMLYATGKNILLRRIKMENKEKKEGILFVSNAKQLTQLYEVIHFGSEVEGIVDVELKVYIKGYPTIIETEEETFYLVNEIDVVGYIA